MKNFLLRWAVLSVAVFAAANIQFLGIRYDSWTAVIVAALVLGIANTFVRPILLVISLPVILLSLGLFVLVINALLFYAAGHIVAGFHVPSFRSALGGSIVVSLVSMLFGVGRHTRYVRYDARIPPRYPPPGKGPIIDV